LEEMPPAQTGEVHGVPFDCGRSKSSASGIRDSSYPRNPSSFTTSRMAATTRKILQRE
jgi:hypothetical protein